MKNKCLRLVFSLPLLVSGLVIANGRAQAIGFDTSSNVWCGSDVKTALEDSSNGMMKIFSNWESSVVKSVTTGGCSTGVGLIDNDTWTAEKESYKTALGGSAYASDGVSNFWTRTADGDSVNKVYAVAASDGASTVTVVDTDYAILPTINWENEKLCISSGSGTSESPYVLTQINCETGPKQPVLSSQTSGEGLYWNIMALSPLQQTATVSGTLTATGAVTNYEITLNVMDGSQLVKSYTKTITAAATGQTLFDFAIPVNDFGASLNNYAFAGPQILDIKNLTTGMTRQLQWNFTFYFPALNPANLVNGGNFIMVY